MKIAIGADHAGFVLKEILLARLREQGHDVEDFGASGTASVDYPDFAEAVARKVAAAAVEKGILVCSSGVGMSIAANKVHGIRAALGTSTEEVELVRRHNDANILAIGAKFSTPETAKAMVDTFLSTNFEGGRHQRRIEKIAALEAAEDKK